jgi:hypothetical protein
VRRGHARLVWANCAHSGRLEGPYQQYTEERHRSPTLDRTGNNAGMCWVRRWIAYVTVHTRVCTDCAHRAGAALAVALGPHVRGQSTVLGRERECVPCWHTSVSTVRSFVACAGVASHAPLECLELDGRKSATPPMKLASLQDWPSIPVRMLIMVLRSRQSRSEVVRVAGLHLRSMQ